MLKQNKKILYQVMLALCLVVGIGILAPTCGLDAKASSGYQKLLDYNNPITKIGNYYFKSTNNTIYIAKKGEAYKKTPIVSYGSMGNNTHAYYVRNKALYKYTYASQKELLLKKLPLSGDETINISTVYKNQIFLTKDSYQKSKLWTYCYNTNTKVLKKVKTNCKINAHYNKYVIGQNSFRTDIDPYPMTLYKITSSGLSKVKTLTSYGRSGTFAGNKIYYTVYPKKHSMKTTTLYRCSLDGKNKKKIASFQAAGENGRVTVGEITSKNCMVVINDQQYRYTYSTKKLKKI